MGKLIAAVPHGSSTDPCCCPPPSCSLFWQVKGGTATLCGFSEFTTPSSPPKKYRKNTANGTATAIFTGGATGCSGGTPCGWTDTFSGTQAYDKTTCGVTGDTIGTRVGSCGNNTSASTVNLCDFYGPVGMSCSPARLLLTMTNDGACHTVGSDSVQYSSANATMTLSDEDTEDDAIARANAGIGSWTPCTPFSESDCSGFKVLRGAGTFSMSYRSAQVQYQASGTIQGALYETTINLQRRLQGTSNPFLDFATITDEFTGPSGSTYLSAWFDIPTQSGYEVAANVCSILPL